ncbi:MAG: YebC/PmpR family DNA-binding transcriptional regulator [Clostridia bacterium]|jgi:YebC/PmpR family DNA-binding regulatory protein
MSGHSKFANIKHRKEKSDSQRAKIFTKIGREIAVVVKQGGADPEGNSKLKDVIAKAKAANVPNDTIARSIKKAAGDIDSTNYEEISYEGYGPGGVAVIVETMTDNRNRTAAEIRHSFDKYGGNMGTTGCVTFMFNKMGVILIEQTGKIDEEKLMTELLDYGIEDFNVEDEYIEILTDPGSFSEVREALEKKGFEFEQAEVSMVPATMTKLTDARQAELMEKLIDSMEELDDVLNIYHNWEQE